jgi:hypothetical protein
MSDLFMIVDQTPQDGEDPPLPKLSDAGRILVQIHGPSHTKVYRHEYEVHDHDGDSSTFWIQEGEGFDYWLDHHCEFKRPGLYVVEGITGLFIKSYWGITDDDVRWEYERIRPANEAEQSSLMLDPVDEKREG